MSESILASKMANALFAEAQTAVTDPLGILDTTIEHRRRVDGGLWVGGRAELTATRLRFAPNAMNKAVHVGGAGLTFDIPLTQVMAVRFRKAFVTNIVEVDAQGGTYSLRCWGAQAFAQTIDQAVRAARA